MELKLGRGRTRRRIWSGCALMTVLLFDFLCASAAAGCVGPLARGTVQPGQGLSLGTPRAHFASIAAGAPITVTAATARLAAPSDAVVLAPVAAYGNAVLVAVSPAAGSAPPTAPDTATGTTYKLWDPVSGSQSPVGGLDSPGSTERVIGSWGDWVLTTRGTSSPTSSNSLVLHNLKTSELRELTSDADAFARSGGNQISADGRVAWASASATSSGPHVYDIASGADTAIQGRAGQGRRFAFQAGKLAAVSGGQTAEVVVRDLAARTSQTVATGSVLSLALSSDGGSLIWIERSSTGETRLLVRDLGSGTTVQVLSGDAVGFGLSVSGQYVSWQPRPGASTAAAGVYNLRTRELRLLQSSPATVPRFAAVMGGWFVWTEGARQATVATPAVAPRTPTGAAAAVYLVKLAP